MILTNSVRGVDEEHTSAYRCTVYVTCSANLLGIVAYLADLSMRWEGVLRQDPERTTCI